MARSKNCDTKHRQGPDIEAAVKCDEVRQYSLEPAGTPILILVRVAGGEVHTIDVEDEPHGALASNWQESNYKLPVIT
jgi:hypothetical protein